MNDQEDQIPGAEISVPAVNDQRLREQNQPQQVTPAQARVEAVADALKAAYANASQLKLTPEEAAALAQDFPDEAFRLGAGGDPGLIYIEHAYLRMRLNTVLGVGAAVPIRRREWAEEFQYYKDGQRKTGVRVYVDMVLVVRGCVVGEAIGDSVYYPDNAKTNYSDALESAKSNAFRRCCKEFGVGLQAWIKGWGEGWKERNRASAPSGRSGGSQGSGPAPATRPAPAQAAKPAAKAADVLPQEATEEQKTRFMTALSNIRTDALRFFVSKGYITDTQPLEELPLKHVPATKKAYEDIMAQIEAFSTQPDPKDAEPWRAYPMPWGRNKDTPLGQLEKNYLFGLVMNYEVEYEYNGQRKKEETIAKDEEFRKMLDAAGVHYEWIKDEPEDEPPF